MAMDRRAALRAGVLGVSGALAGCLGPVGENGRVPTESVPRSVLRVTDAETVRFAVRRAVGWDEASGFVVLVDSAARQRALLTKYRLPDDRRDRILEFLEDVDYGRERLVLVESVGPDQCHDALEVEAVGVGDGGITAEATVRTSDADDCGQALAYPSSLLRARFNGEPPDEATVEVTDGRGGTSTVTATAGDPLSPAPEDLPGNVRPAADAEPVPSLDCETAGAERHDQRFDEADLAWGDYPGEGSPRLAIRVDNLTSGHGETLVVPEALGTVSYFRAPGERLGVHPMLRALPPRSLREYDAERLLVGHGEGLFEDVRPAVEDAVGGSRRRMVPLYLDNLKGFLGSG